MRRIITFLLIYLFATGFGDVFAQREATYGNSQVFDAGYTNWVGADRIDDLHFLVVWKDGGSGTSTPISAVIGKVDSVTRTVSYGPVKTIESSPNARPEIAVLNSTQAVVSYEADLSNDLGYARLIEFDVATKTINTVNSAITFHNDDINWADMERIDDNTVAIAYRAGDATANYTGSVVIGNVSGSTLSFGSEQIFSDTAMGPADIKLVSTNRIIIGFESDGDANDPGKAIIGDITGTNVSFGAMHTFHSSGSTAACREVGVGVINSSTVIIGYGDDANSDYGKLRIGTITGSSISTGAAITFESSQDVRDIHIEHLQGNEFVFAYNGFSDPSSFFIAEYNSSTSSIDLGTERQFLSTQADDAQPIVLNDDLFVIPYVDDSHSDSGHVIVGTLASLTLPISISITSQTNVNCYGSSTGSLTATVSNGTANYDYAWSNGLFTNNTSSTSSTNTSLAAGTYTVTVTDDNGANATVSATVTQPASGVSSSISAQTNVSCNGLSNGSLTVSASSGSSPYTYAWNTGATTATESSLAAGTYTVTVTDNNGCTTTSSATITQPTAVAVSVVVDSNVSCNSYMDGGLSTSVSGGTAPYLYSWSNTGTTAAITGLAAGTYTVTVTDNNGCTATNSNTVTQPAALSVSVVVDSNTSCNGYADGGLTSSPNGGTSPYSYAWNNGATTASITGITAGTYTVTVTDNNGCTATNTGTVTQPAALSASTVVDSNASCNGYMDGGATASYTGGTAGGFYPVYAWNNGATTASITGISAGTYTVTITDFNGCTSTSSVTITQPTATAVSVVVDSNVSCNSFLDGGLTSSPSGGTAPYTYSWNNAASTASITGLSAGTYTVTITDNNGCTASNSNTVTQPAALAASVVVDSNVACNGYMHGGLTSSASGGTAPYLYTWSNTGTTASITGLAAGTYTVTITDNKGCTSSDDGTITEPVVLSASVVVDSNASCNGYADGGLTSSASGGTAPYSYAWNNGATTASIAGVTAGTYTVTITDNNGCTNTSSGTVTQPVMLAASVVIDSNVTCNSYLDGGLTSSASGGTAPYTYSWNNGATTASITGVAAGTYTVTITDNNGCTVNNSGTVTQPVALAASVVIDSNVTCNGFSDGGMTSSASGGTTPYTYNWSNTATTASITGIVAGTYTVTITDNNGCTASNSGTVTQPVALVAASVVDSNATCGSNDGGATASATGGTTPYSYQWSNSATTASIAGIGAGTYTVTITDNNGCTSTSSATITSTATVSASVTVNSNASCNGYADGSMTASASSGSTPYSYLWSNAGTTAAITGLTAGTYTVTVTDNNGCTATASGTITQPTAVVAASVTDNNVSCNGYADGGATASASGGTLPYSYLWSNAATTASITGVVAGTYTVTVTDNNGCTSTSSVTVTEPAVLVAASVVDSNVTCNGYSDGGATAAATGGTTPYSYAWSNTATTASITGIIAGTYTVTITDNNACSSTSSVTITEPTILVAATVVDSNASCNGLADGGATASATGGTMPYSYAWSNGATTASVAGIAAGTYTVTITDNNACTSTSSVTITEPTVLAAATVVDSNASCNGLSDGGATAAATGGTMPYSYAWSNSATTASIAGVAAGTYTVTVTDNNGCTSTSSVTITEPAVLVAATFVDSNVSCNGLADGGATAAATGGTMPYSYAWNNGATTASIAGVAAGTYTVTITDNNGCTSTSSVTITEPVALVAATVVDSNVTCNGLADGGATAAATGGTMPYSYVWNNGATTASITGIIAGTYTVTITDNNACSSTSSVTITEPTILVAATVVDSNASCNGLADGGATASATGATMPYSYAWSNGATTASVAGIAAGTYTVTITDNNACTSTSSVTITEPTVLAAATVVDSNASCNGLSDGGATASATGGTMPYSYAWSNTASTASVTGISAGTYTVTVADNNGCTSTSSVTITEPTILVAATVVDSNASCNGLADGGATAAATGGTMPYSYAWSNTATTASIAGVAAGTYTVTVTDNNGCTSTSSVTIIEPTILAAATVVDSNVSCNGFADGGATASATGGTAPYSYLWSNAATTASIAGVVAGTYTVTVIDQNLCSSSSSVTVTEPVALVATTVVDSNVSCNGLSDGGATASATGGTTPYTYLWSNAATTASIAGVAAGTYTVTISDQNACSSTSSVTLTEPTVLVAATVVDSNASCNGFADGGATASATGGTTPYSYEWSNAATTASITGVIAGTYTVTITDANGCVSTSSVTLTEPTALVATAVMTGTASCGSMADGSAAASATGGIAPYSYLWSNNTATAANSGIAAGTYTVTVTDANGCIASDTTAVLSNDIIPPTVVTQDLTVYLDNSGMAVILPSQVDNGSSDNCGIVAMELSTDTFDCIHIGANTVSLTLTDQGNNTASANATITVMDTLKPNVLTQNITVYLDGSGMATITEADVNNGSSDNCGILSTNATHTQFTCSDTGMVTGYLYVTDNNSLTDSAAYVVSVMDTLKPTVMTQNQTVYLDSMGMATVGIIDLDNGTTDNCGIDSLMATKTQITCSDTGTVTGYLIASDHSGNMDSAMYTLTVMDTIMPFFEVLSDTSVCSDMITFATPVVWDNCAGITPMQIGGPAPGSVQAPGDYYIVFEATDHGGNTIMDSLMVTLLPVPVIDLGPDTTICVNWDVSLSAPSGFTYEWSDGSTNQNYDIAANSLTPGTYTVSVTVTNNEGCSATDEIIVTVDPCININNVEEEYFKLYPNPNKGEFTIETGNINEDLVIEILNTKGQIIYKQIHNAEDGHLIHLKQGHLAKGMYYIRLSQDHVIRYEKMIVQ